MGKAISERSAHGGIEPKTVRYILNIAPLDACGSITNIDYRSAERIANDVNARHYKGKEGIGSHQVYKLIQHCRENGLTARDFLD